MRYPVDHVSVTSGYGARRDNNVRHWGLDLAGRAGDAVRTPEAGFVVATSWGRGTAVALPPPFNGYGPGVVLLRGSSGVWHLLAHLDPAHRADIFKGETLPEGFQVATMPPAVGRAGPHTHWEVRGGVPYDAPDNRQHNTMDPRAWLRGEPFELSRGVVPSMTDVVIDTAVSAVSKTNGASSPAAAWLLLALLLFAKDR